LEREGGGREERETETDRQSKRDLAPSSNLGDHHAGLRAVQR
jgi:hypothetical protein